MRKPAFFCSLYLVFAIFTIQVLVAERPNILFIYTDDQAPWALGAAVERGLFDEVPAAHTPHLDQLAAEGAILSNQFCATPVCSPARAAIMTGRYASEFGILDFIPDTDHKLYNPDYQPGLNTDDSVTFAEVLQANGYATGLVGKWHVGDWTGSGYMRHHPTRHGFDYFMGLTSGGTKPSNPVLEEEGVVKEFEGLTTDILTDRALGFIKKQKDRPFLLCLHTRAPHGAWLPVAPEDWKPYADMDPELPNFPDLNIKKMKNSMREYLASVSGVDRNVGRVLNLLNDLGLTEKTIVIFSSDHGYNMGHNGIWHKGNGLWATQTPPVETHQGTKVISDKYRPNMYDLSLKVPTIIKWPGVTKAGTVIKDTTRSLDIFPTILDMAGINIPKDIPLRGRSLVPLLKGETPSDWPQDYYGEYHMINYVEADMRCYRTPEWKLIRDFKNEGRDELYHLKNDPGEAHNLIHESSPEIESIFQMMNQALLAKMNQISR
ncbi:MAG: sulfatase-like hydrolase/transferase [Verrucomicrobia bacterium]|nr:sulfatase-like hydrolase/transferase [Verrucomicrobiota bacterium]